MRSFPWSLMERSGTAVLAALKLDHCLIVLNDKMLRLKFRAF